MNYCSPHRWLASSPAITLAKASVLAIACLMLLAGSAHPAPDEYSEDVAMYRARFDRLAARMVRFQAFDGLVAPWSQGYVLLGYVAMFEATGDTAYLDEFIDIGDQVMAHRDSERGLRDYRGRSLPAWQGRPSYVLHRAVLPDTEGRPTLLVLLREWMRPHKGAIEARIENVSDGRFSLVVAREHDGLSNLERFDNVSMNPDALALDTGTYAERRINGFSKFVTVHDLRPKGSATGALPAEGTYPFGADGYVFHVHTGHLTHPFARMSRLVMESDELRAHPRYGAKARQYLEAVKEAVAVHDEDWRQNKRGEGWYVAAPGAPIWNAGIHEPLNHCHTLGLTMCELYRITGEKRYRDRVTRLARAFKKDLRYRSDTGAYWWSYWWTRGRGYGGWRSDEGVPSYLPFSAGQPKPEDTAHGGISVRFAWSAYESGIVFDRQDMERLANTLVDVVPGEDLTIPQRVTGTGPPIRSLPTARWVDLALEDIRVYWLVKRLYLRSYWGGSEGLFAAGKLAAVASKLPAPDSNRIRLANRLFRMEFGPPPEPRSIPDDLGVSTRMREVNEFRIPSRNIAENADLRMGLTGFELGDVPKWIMHGHIEPDLQQKLTGASSVRVTLDETPGVDTRIRLFREVKVRPRARGYKVGWVLRLQDYNGIAGARIFFKDDDHWVQHPVRDQIYYDVIALPDPEDPAGPGPAPLTGTTSWLNVEATIDFARMREAKPHMAEGGVRMMLVDVFCGGAAEGATQGGDGDIWLDCFYVVPQ